MILYYYGIKLSCNVDLKVAVTIIRTMDRPDGSCDMKLPDSTIQQPRLPADRVIPGEIGFSRP